MKLVGPTARRSSVLRLTYDVENRPVGINTWGRVIAVPVVHETLRCGNPLLDRRSHIGRRSRHLAADGEHALTAI